MQAIMIAIAIITVIPPAVFAKARNEKKPGVESVLFRSDARLLQLYTIWEALKSKRSQYIILEKKSKKVLTGWLFP